MSDPEIGFVCNSPYWGGAEKYLGELAHMLDGQGLTPLLLGRMSGWPESFDRVDLGIEDKWGGRRTLRLLPQLPRELRALDEVLSTVNGRIGLFHGQFKREQIAFSERLRGYAPVVWTEHGRFPNSFEGRALMRAYVRASRHAQTIICVSSAVADCLMEGGVRASKLEVIANAVDQRLYPSPTPAMRKTARTRLFNERAVLNSPREVVVSWVGQVHKGKLPSWLAEFARIFPGPVVVAGDGPAMPELRRDAKDGIVPLGKVDYVVSVLHACDVHLFTSTGEGEGLPYSVIEAAMTGLPILTNSGSGLEALMAPDGLRAFHSPAEAAAWLAEAPSGTIKEMGRAAREWALSLSRSTWDQQHLEVFRGAMRSG